MGAYFFSVSEEGKDGGILREMWEKENAFKSVMEDKFNCLDDLGWSERCNDKRYSGRMAEMGFWVVEVNISFHEAARVQSVYLWRGVRTE